ncbi:hypothetical protein A0H81_11402 [Grifola frondosa]|uniref:Uncharacterized protein n=1 Tax=Grifola frondosa TaxID=5627 RepID=A0A1C7LVD4_GRIFR|nr:hypothetical protein A0H81_11402 [Grifola frondosa]
MDWANPKTRAHLELYPIRTSSVSESYHAGKWVRGIDPELQAPMWADGSKHYYLGELAQLENGDLVVPRCWYHYKSGGEVYAEAFKVEEDEFVGTLTFTQATHS